MWISSPAVSIPGLLDCRPLDGAISAPTWRQTMEASIDPSLARGDALAGAPSHPSASPAPHVSQRARRIGLAVSSLPSLFLLFDASIKLLHLAPVTEAFARLGLPTHLAPWVGLLELALLTLHLVPRTAVLGAVLLTGFLGGAVALHVRLGDPLASHTLFPVYVGALFWVGLALRDARVRGLLTAPAENRPSPVDSKRTRVS